MGKGERSGGREGAQCALVAMLSPHCVPKRGTRKNCTHVPPQTLRRRTLSCLSLISEVTSRMLDMSQITSLLSRPTEANLRDAGEYATALT